MRGIVNEQLTPLMALRLGMAVATFFGDGCRILVGRDVRCGGDMIAKAVMAGVMAAGGKPYYAGYAPTPAIQYGVKTLGYDAGIIVTASHNPPPYNGIKVIGALGVEIRRRDERAIEEIYFSERYRIASWKALAEDAGREDRVIDNYVDAVVSMVDVDAIRRRGFRVVADCANSVGALTTPRILRRLGAKCLCVNCNLDPYFPARQPEPTPETLATTSCIVRSVGADLGVGHDGDADRAILVDEKGEVWWGDRTGSLLAAYVAGEYPGAPRRVYTAVSSSILVEEYLSKHGLTVEWTPVGAINISYKLVEEGGVAGFEENGGYIHPPHQLVRDGGMTLALFLEMMAREGAKASELFARLPRYYAVKTKIEMPRSKAVEAVRIVAEKYAGYRQVRIDGVKVFGEGWWFLVRPSGTEPVLRIMVEARSREEAVKLANSLIELVKAEVLGVKA